MPIETIIDRDAWRAVHTVSGIVDFDDVTRAIRYLFSGHSGFVPGMDILTLIEKGCRASLDYAQIAELVEQIRHYRSRREGGRTAVVAVDDESFGISRMMETMLAFDGREVRVFREHCDAVAWLEEKR